MAAAPSSRRYSQLLTKARALERDILEKESKIRLLEADLQRLKDKSNERLTETLNHLTEMKNEIRAMEEMSLEEQKTSERSLRDLRVEIRTNINYKFEAEAWTCLLYTSPSPRDS